MKELSFVTEMGARGRITIPQTIRTLLELKEKDIIKIGYVQKITKEIDERAQGEGTGR